GKNVIPIAGHEEPGITVFPLCDRHHCLAHHSSYWRRYRAENTPAFYKLLRIGWMEKVLR
ncbi:hypothetical protein, partial [Coleofasciculus sp. LEGE 07081]|uniref:hypothetical protein n=1 Tax=Coleofasciculus sp. LEGE 07081 TaxID=2777967 RepID=UPI001D15C79F